MLLDQAPIQSTLALPATPQRSSSVDFRSSKPLVLAPEQPSFHTQDRAILHMSVEHSRVRRVRRPHGAMPSRPMRAQIRLV